MSVISVKEHVSRSLDTLSEAEPQQVADYVAFLQFRARFAKLCMPDAEELAPLYAEFAFEDRMLAETGLCHFGFWIADYRLPHPAAERGKRTCCMRNVQVELVLDEYRDQLDVEDQQSLSSAVKYSLPI